MVTIKAGPLTELVGDIFAKAGCSAEEGRRIGKYLVSANLTGHDSHGVARVPRYVQWKRDGVVQPDRKVKVVSETPVLAVVDGLSQAPRGPAVEREWFSAFGHVMESHWLFVLGALSVAPGLAGAFSSRGRSLALRLGLAAAFTLLLARHPVPALWVFFLPNLVLAFRPRRWLSALVWAPLVLLVGLGGVAWLRGFVRGVWLAPWELLLGVAAVGLWWILKASPLHERERSSRA